MRLLALLLLPWFLLPSGLSGQGVSSSSASSSRSPSTAKTAAPRRIVSTSPSLTETLFALGLGDRIVGVTTFCRYPAEAQSKPKIGTFIQPDPERILAQRPDLVLTVKNPVQLTERLRKLGLHTEEVKQDSVADILHGIDEIGVWAGVPDRALALHAKLQSGMDEVKRRAASRPRVSVLFVVDRTPGSLQGMFGSGVGSYLDELLTLAGGHNVLSGVPGLYPRLSLELILARDPEAIIDMGDYSHGRAVTTASSAQKLALWSRYSSLRAVRNHRVYDVADDHFVVQGPRMVEAAREFLKMLHPELAR